MPAGYYFDKKAADHAVSFFPRAMVHTVGEWAGEPFVLASWQKRITRSAFGWKRCSDGTRRYRTIYIEIPKKNGKSTWAAGLALLLTGADGEPRANVYSAAADKEQARAVFDEASEFVQASRVLRKRYRLTKDSIWVPGNRGRYKVLSRVAATKHGLNVHGIVIDELHAIANRALIDALDYGGASRRQPMTIFLTTAGVDRQTIAYEKHEYAQGVLAGLIPDDTFLPVIYGASYDDDWEDPRVWEKVNPGYGVTVKADYLRSKYLEATQTPAKRSVFRQLHLNTWMQKHQRAIDMRKWKKGAAPIDVRALHGRPCWAGLDLASRRDLASIGLVFPRADGGFFNLVWNYMPGDNVVDRVKSDRVSYVPWIEDGFITTTRGTSIDYDTIRRDVNALGRRFDIRELAFDRWDATQIRQQLEGDGFEAVQFGQGFASMNEPSKVFDVLAHDGGWRHGGNPVNTWSASNLVWEHDAADNLKPSKKESTDKIDPTVASLMGLGRALAGVGSRVGRYARGEGVRSVPMR